MSVACLRRAVLASFVSLALVLAGPVAALPGGAPATAEMMTFAPGAAFTGGPALVEVTTRGSYRGGDAELTITPTAEPGETPLDIGATLLPGQYRTTITPQGSDGSRWAVPLDLQDPNGTPAAPRLYDAQLWIDGEPVESCTGCFTILTRSAPALRSCADLTPRALQRGETLTVRAVGTSFADGTVLEVLSGKVPDPSVTVDVPAVHPFGHDRDSLLTREVTVLPDAALGYRTVRVTNTDGRSSLLANCFTVTAPADKVEPTGVTNDVKRVVRLTVPELLPKGAVLRLVWVGAGAPRPALDLVATSSVVVPGLPSVLEGSVDFTGATPGLNAYHARYLLPDGSVHDCAGLCRFTVRQPAPPLITAPAKGLDAKTAVRTVVLTGTGLTRGTTVVSEDADVVVQSVRWTSPTSLTLVVAVAPGATGDSVVFTVANPDGQSSSFDSGAIPLPPPGPPVAATDDGSQDPDPSRAPETPSLRLSRTVLTQQQWLYVSGRAEPGVALDLFGVTRPGNQPQLIRTITAVANDGAWSFSVAPSFSTRYHVVARNGYGRTATESLGVQVRSVVRSSWQKSVGSRPGLLRAAVSGQVLPARKGVRVRVLVLGRSGRVQLGPTVVTGANGRWTLPVQTLRGSAPVRVQAETAADVRNAVGSSVPLTLG